MGIRLGISKKKSLNKFPNQEAYLEIRLFKYDLEIKICSCIQIVQPVFHKNLYFCN